MSPRLTDLTVDQLAGLLKEKTAFYNQMIDDNKEFHDVKTLFLEIKEIVAALSQLQDSQTTANLQNLQPEYQTSDQ